MRLSSRLAARCLAAFSLTLVLALAFGAPRDARAHDYDETRRLLVTVDTDAIEVLVVWELPAGPEAELLRGMIDLDRDGAIADSGWEPIVQAQLLGPRLLRGLSLELAGTAVTLAPDRVAYRDGAGDGARRGFVAMLLLQAARSLPEPPTSATVRVALAPDTPATQLELQLGDGVELVDSPVPPAPDAPVIGPLALIPGAPAALAVRRAAPPSPGSPPSP